MTRGDLRCMVVTMALYGASGCAGTEADLARANAADEVSAGDVGPARIALHAGTAAAGPDDIDGYCERGVGVYLSASADRAELTVYVVAPAEAATFERPALHLTVQDGSEQRTQVSEFDSVTLLAGESRAFSVAAEGTLMNAVAEVAAE